MSKIRQDEYYEFVKNDKIVRHTVNGISRFLILWIIRDEGPIHGYRIVKEINIFFDSIIANGSLKKLNHSKIYPILKTMEENGLISGEYQIRDNKKVKFYIITDKGEYLLNYIKNSYKNIRRSSKGTQFYNFLND